MTTRAPLMAGHAVCHVRLAFVTVLAVPRSEAHLVTTSDWRTSAAGAKVRAALWLYTEIGEGGVFTKDQLRAAFPGVAQIDRRVRDLRSEGWKITTYGEDRSLAPDQQRLVRVGGKVWLPGYRSQQVAAVSDKERAGVLAADGFACSSCGIGAGEGYPDDPVRTAKLVVKRVEAPSVGLSTLCTRCAGGGGKLNADTVLDAFAALAPDVQSQVRTWMRQDGRSWTAAERWWATYRALPATERAKVLSTVRNPR